jgi:NAD(P)-dependent dehydrogenase (short-subunit alcohol dehydrogenase family)
VGGRVGTPGLSAYQASKWAVGGLTEVLAAELGPLGVKVTCVEPGGMRTDWAGSSMKVHEPKPDYAATVGAFTAQARHNQDMGRSDPKRCAQALLELVAMEKPPVHLLFGSDATFMAELALTRRSAEDRVHRTLSESTDYPNQPRFADTPIAQYLRDHAG